MKKVFLPCLLSLISFQTLSLIAQNKPNPNKMWDLVVTPYNAIADKSYNLTVDLVHSDRQTMTKLATDIVELKKNITTTVEFYNNMPSDIPAEFNKLRLSALTCTKALEVFLGLDNMQKTLQTPAPKTARESLNRFRESEVMSRFVDSVNNSFHNTASSFAKLYNIKFLEGDTSSSNARKRVSDVFNFTHIIQKIYLEPQVPFEDFMTQAANQDTTNKIVNIHKILQQVLKEKKAQLNTLKTSKPNDILLKETAEYIEAMEVFSNTECPIIIKGLKTPADERTEQQVRQFNMAVNTFNTELVPRLNSFSQSIEAYKRTNIPPRKTTMTVVPSED